MPQQFFDDADFLGPDEPTDADREREWREREDEHMHDAEEQWADRDDGESGFPRHWLPPGGRW